MTLQNRDISFISSDGRTYEMRKELFVEFFTFASEINELIGLYEKNSWKITTRLGMWDKLLVARWCYKIPFSYWARKKLRFDSRYLRKESWERLNLHALWCEMNAIKKRNFGNGKTLFFKLNILRFT